MKRPPVLATWLLRVACPPHDLPYVLGDLEAEFELRGEPAGWYWSQTLRSVGVLAMMGNMLAIFLAPAAPPVLMESCWSFVLSQVPLKADAMRHSDFALISLALTAALTLCAGGAWVRHIFDKPSGGTLA